MVSELGTYSRIVSVVPAYEADIGITSLLSVHLSASPSLSQDIYLDIWVTQIWCLHCCYSAWSSDLHACVEILCVLNKRNLDESSWSAWKWQAILICGTCICSVCSKSSHTLDVQFSWQQKNCYWAMFCKTLMWFWGSNNTAASPACACLLLCWQGKSITLML